MDITLKQLKSLLKTLEEGSVTEFEYQDDKYRLRMSVGRAAQVGAPDALASGSGSAAPPTSIPMSGLGEPLLREDPNVLFVTSPFVGTFYRASNPDSEVFVEVGSSVKQGETLCIVEAMKLMNEIEAEFACIVEEILVENGASVEFGQKLFKVKKS